MRNDSDSRVRLQRVGYLLSDRWSPDGRGIVFTAGDRIWKIARAGGAPSEIGIALRGTPGQIDWSPDGKRLVFAFDSGRETELWLMTGFQH